MGGLCGHVVGEGENWEGHQSTNPVPGDMLHVVCVPSIFVKYYRIISLSHFTDHGGTPNLQPGKEPCSLGLYGRQFVEKQELRGVRSPDPRGALRGQRVLGTGSGKKELVVRVGQGTGIGDISQD